MNQLRSRILQRVYTLTILLTLSFGFPVECLAQVADTHTVVTYEAAEVVQEDSVTYRMVEQAVIDSFKRDPDFRYANDPEYWKKEEKKSNTFFDSLFRVLSSQAVRFIFYASLIAIAIFVVYRIIAVNGMFSRSSGKKTLHDEEPVSGNTRESIDQDIQQAISAGNTREAVRLLHLRTLYLLDAKSLISFDQQSTNDVYLRQLTDTDYRTDFSYLTRIYEYVWYGDFTVTSMQFASIRDSFETFKSRLGA